MGGEGFLDEVRWQRDRVRGRTANTERLLSDLNLDRRWIVLVTAGLLVGLMGAVAQVVTEPSWGQGLMVPGYGIMIASLVRHLGTLRQSTETTTE